jgi:hypothetical protein
MTEEEQGMKDELNRLRFRAHNQTYNWTFAKSDLIL